MTSLSDHDRSSTILVSRGRLGTDGRQPRRSVDRRTASVVGAAVAAAICVVIAAIGWQIAPRRLGARHRRAAGDDVPGAGR